MRRVVLAVGTQRGLFLLDSAVGRRRWTTTGPLRSDDGGAKWKRINSWGASYVGASMPSEVFT